MAADVAARQVTQDAGADGDWMVMLAAVSLRLRQSPPPSLAEALPGAAAGAPAAVAVLFIDLDGFKQVDDRHGHGVGDAVLRIVGARLRRTGRAQDLIGRLGGDAFACLDAEGLQPAA